MYSKKLVLELPCLCCTTTSSHCLDGVSWPAANTFF